MNTDFNAAASNPLKTTLTTKTTSYAIVGRGEIADKLLKFSRILPGRSHDVAFIYWGDVDFVDSLAEATSFDDYKLADAIVNFIHQENFAYVDIHSFTREVFTSEVHRRWRERDIRSLSVKQLRQLARFYEVSLKGASRKADLQAKLTAELAY